MEEATFLKLSREASGETVTSMARKLEIGVSRYHMIENGNRPASPDIAARISRIIGVPQYQLFRPVSFTVRRTPAPTGTEGGE